MNRQERRAEKARILRKRLNEIWWLKDFDSTNAKIMIDTPCRSSGVCCGNPRKHFGRVTKQEKQIALEQQEEINSLEGEEFDKLGFYAEH